MNIYDLKKKLQQLGTPDSWYHLEQYGNDDQKLTIKNENCKWIVYYSERGNRFNISEYTTESEACEDLLRRIKERFDFYRNFVMK